MYPFVSATSLRIFQCKNVEGTYYLLSDFSLQCYDSRWYRFVGAACLMVILYPIGIPTLFGYIIWKYRYRLDEPGIRIQMGFLYEAYWLDMWWFELSDMINKVFLTAVVGFFPSNVQMPIALCWITSYLGLILLRTPYIRKGDDRLHQFVLVQLYCIIYVAYILVDNGNNPLGESSDLALSIILILGVCGLILLFLVTAGVSITKLLRGIQRDKTLNKTKSELIRQQEIRDKLAVINPLFIDHNSPVHKSESPDGTENNENKKPKMSFFRSARSIFGSNAPKPNDEKALIPQNMSNRHDQLDIQSIMNEINTGEITTTLTNHSNESLSPLSASAGANSYSDVRKYMPATNLQVDENKQTRRSTNGETINPALVHTPPEL